MTVVELRSRMQSSSESVSLPPAGSALPSLSRSRSVREQQAQLKHKLRELPSLLRSGLTLRRRSSVYGPSPSFSESEETAAATATSSPITTERISNLYGESSAPKFYGESVACAGRALRNALRSQAPDLIRDRMYLTCICRKSCVGSELVDWLLQQCPFVQCRYTAAGIWQTLLKLGILLSVDKQLCFQDAYVFYQFSSSDCPEAVCEFGKEKEWHMGVRLLKQLAPLAPLTSNICDMSAEKLETATDANNKILQIQALARLTSAVQRELAAVIALKARKSVSDDEEFNCPQQSGPVNTEHALDTEAGVMCKLHGREELRRIDFVQKLSRENQSLPPSAKQLEKKLQDEEATTVQVREQDHDVLVLKKVYSSESPAPTAGSAETDWRYVVVSGTPEKILEHLLNDLHLDDLQDKETDTLLDDFLLTYTVFMTTDDLCQALLRHYCANKYDGRVESPEALCTKRKVLLLASQWTALYKDWLHDDEHSKLFLKTLYRYVLDDIYEYPMLEKELKEFQKVLRIHRRHTVDEYSPHRKSKALFHQFSLKENWLQHRGNVNDIEEIFCRVYITDHSYVSIRTKVSSSVQDILKLVAERIQYPEEDLALVTVTFSGEKHELLPTEIALSKTLESTSRIYTYRKSDTLNPFAENEETQHRSVRILGMNTWDIALELTSFDWSLFNSIHEQELIYFTFSRQGKSENTLNLSLLLQRCNEVQLWVATEILLCNQLGKRVQLMKKFIKIAAHCKAQRNLNSFFAIIMGLNTASVCRLSQTWEKIPGKFKKLFSELESLTDPSLNHKAYRDTFKKMKPPKIPFMPLLLKDVTFIHEGNKTFLDNLVNFEKLHMIADTVRSLRHCRNNQYGNDSPQKEHLEVKFYTNHLYVIDNQQTLFELSHRIEPRA
ncbi:rap guanine nucleotide exchange factor 5 isoform X1 [Pelobates cultripes]|uniref:Rap guanine nucleotide exchange factor 5 isoform X1 n=1 Tax=Pelobates cultripes TaxID=61616 RepID=A0AAD1RY44_PELCU|nr:rap guanine nucleotide exchange factor 5 isoform X1 [Pelobates cultripes]